MEESYSKLDSTQKIVVKLFQQSIPTGYTALYSVPHHWVTESTDLLPASQPLMYSASAGYRVSLPSSNQPAVS